MAALCEGDLRLCLGDVGKPEFVARRFERGASNAGVLRGLPEIPQADVDEGQLVLDRRRLRGRLAGTEECQALEARSDRRFHVPGRSVAERQRIEQRRAPSIIEVRADSARFLQQEQGPFRLARQRHHRCQGDEDPDVEIGLERGRTPVGREETLQQQAGLRRVICLVVRRREPVARRPGRLDLTRRRQELVRLGGNAHGFGGPSQPAECLGQAEENLPPLEGRRIRVEN